MALNFYSFAFVASLIVSSWVASTHEVGSHQEKFQGPAQKYMGTLGVLPVSNFDDGNDKELIIYLRRKIKDGGVATALESAFLQPASRTGHIACIGAKVASNATLVQIDGRDAIITTAHAFIDRKTGEFMCDLSRIGFYPNLSFYDSNAGEPTEWERKLALTDGSEPLNLENVRETGNIPVAKDFLIFYLRETVSVDVLPDGSIRGFMNVKTDAPAVGAMHLIGTDVDFRNGLATTWQTCEYSRSNENLLHTCDAIPSVSSSALVYFTGYEMHLLGIQTSEVAYQPKNRPLPRFTFDRNYGLSIDYVDKFIKSNGLSFTAKQEL